MRKVEPDLTGRSWDIANRFWDLANYVVTFAVAQTLAFVTFSFTAEGGRILCSSRSLTPWLVGSNLVFLTSTWGCFWVERILRPAGGEFHQVRMGSLYAAIGRTAWILFFGGLLAWRVWRHHC